MHPSFHTAARLGAPLLVLSLSACANLPADWGRGAVAETTAARGLSRPEGDVTLLSQQLLARPLGPDEAVSLALLNNPELRGTTAGLGFAAAEVYDAARLSNPSLSAARLSSNDPAASRAQLSLGIAVSFTDLLFLPARSRLARTQFETAKLEVADQTLRLAAQVESAWYRLAGAQQTAAMRAAIARAAAVSATLAERHQAAGTLSRRALAIEQAAASEAALAAETAAAEAAAARSALNRLLGLAADGGDWQLSDGLPALPAQELDRAELLRLAAESRLDLAVARQQADRVAATYGLERRSQGLGEIEIGLEHERETDGSRLFGPSLSWQLPLFNWGGGRKAQAEAALQIAEAELRGRELDASNEVADGLLALQSARRRALQLRDQLIPQREAVVEQTQRELNYMLVGAFELILAKQQEYAAYADYLAAVTDYWVARSELSRAVGRRLPEPPASAQRLDAETLLKPAAVEAEAPAHQHGDAP